MRMAFTVESMSLRMLVFSGTKIESWYSIPLGPNMVKEGIISGANGVGNVMAEAMREHDIPGKGVVAAVPSAGSASQTLNLPGVKKSNLKEVVRREIRRTMPGTHDSDFFYWQQLPGNGGQIYALAVPKSSVVGVIDTCRAGGMKLKGIELKPFTLLRAVNCESGIIVHGETDSIEIVIVDNSFPAMFRNIPVKDAAATVEGASQNLLRELPFTIDFYNRSSQGSELKAEAPVYLSGELALDPELAAQVAQVSGREVMALNPPVECPESFPVEQYLATVGLMLRERW